MLAEFTREELTAGLDAVVEEVLARARVESPPIDAFAVAQALGLAVAWDDRQEGRARYVRIADRRAASPRAAILLRPEPRCERRQWAVAHEIGEHVVHRVFAVWAIDPREAPPNAREAVANFFAGRLLLPTAWFESDAGETGWDLLALKMRYATASHELIARRMLECRPPVIVTIFDQDKITFRRGNLPGRAPPPTAAELSCQREVRQCNEPRERRMDLCRIACWPIHETDWKREIMRTEVEED
jgi:hypothetical protein